MVLSLYNLPAFQSFLKNNSHEKGEVEFLESIANEGMNANDVGVSIDDLSMGSDFGNAEFIYAHN
ncbi:MAG TPA: hypothetical protein G4N93_06090 [Dehalococcoidia bacterium]|nr:hypothetical protein [Dehalococcoidia bacterium]